jgi:hypothetical protein
MFLAKESHEFLNDVALELASRPSIRPSAAA